MIFMKFVYQLICIFFQFIIFQDEVIQQDDEIRLKIVGTRVDAKDIVSYLSMMKQMQKIITEV